MKITIIGCGSSMGVPVLGCFCGTCISNSKYNKRTRSSILVECDDVSILVDTSPEMRIQALTHNITSIDAVLFTHIHADHCQGIHDLQSFLPKNGLKYIMVYSDFFTLCGLLSNNSHLFIPNISPVKKCSYLVSNVIERYKKFNIGSCEIIAVRQNHGNIESNGFIFNDQVAYCTDVKSFPDEESLKLLSNKRVLILGCLQYQENKAHAHLDLCLEWIKTLSPKTAILTHMSHHINYHELKLKLQQVSCKSNILPAYDGLEIVL